MSKHVRVDGKLLQVNKSYGQLKNKQKEKIGNWMYKAYKRQTAENLSDDSGKAEERDSFGRWHIQHA